MIIVNLKGGLGNQMFQYALGRALAIKNADDLKLDVSGLDRANDVGDIYRPFALSAFSIQAAIADQTEIQKHKYPWGLVSKLLRRFAFKVLRRTHIGWEPEILTKTGDVYLDGYWQSPKYFEDIRGVILEDFTLVHPFSPDAQRVADQMSSTTSVSIHIRRGDYTTAQTSAVHGLCSLAYYRRSIEKILQHEKNPVWFVFSDDIEWVKQNLPLEGQVVYVSGGPLSDAEEMTLMSCCKHNIIANSSFSWWGAWLNRNPEKIVIAPTPWFNTVKDFHKDLIPQSWHTIPRNP